jgi:hypothetical protein
VAQASASLPASLLFLIIRNSVKWEKGNPSILTGSLGAALGRALASYKDIAEEDAIKGKRDYKASVFHKRVELKRNQRSGAPNARITPPSNQKEP